MYYGHKFDVPYFNRKLGLSAVEGTTDDRGCHFVFINTISRFRTSQIIAVIDDYNDQVPSARKMRLQEEIYQPVIVTMSTKKMEGTIYSKIKEDKEKQSQGGKSNFWFWDHKSNESNGTLQNDTEGTEDLLVQQQAMEEHPEAFGGSSSTAPESSGKRRAEVSSIDPSKKLRSSDGDLVSVAGEESALETELAANAEPPVSVRLFHCVR
jgi:hypothetical protein